MERLISISKKRTEKDRYEKLIEGEIPARNMQEKIIQDLTKKDAGLALAIIGLDHPASITIHKYLVKQKYHCISPHALLIRHKLDSYI